MGEKPVATFKRTTVAAIGAVVAICCTALWCLCCCGGSTTTVILARHADRAAAADALSAAGLVRAQELVHLLEKSGVSAIYHTEATRTQQTAAPLAGTLAIAPVVFNAADTAGLVADIKSNHAGETVLVVGHSNTVPQIIEALGGPAMANIAENEFDNLFLLTRRCRCGCSVRLVNLQYGAASP